MAILASQITEASVFFSSQSGVSQLHSLAISTAAGQAACHQPTYIVPTGSISASAVLWRIQTVS